jgi:competence protein ComEC
MPATDRVFAARPLTDIYDKPRDQGGKRANVVLLGTWLGITKDQGDWLQVTAPGKDGWVLKGDTRADCGLKVFFIDVGQGDACLIEAPNGRILVDGGPKGNTHGYLSKYQYAAEIAEKKAAGDKVFIDAVVVTHFDGDHFLGLTPLLSDANFRFGTLYHNGIGRFDKAAAPGKYNTEIGRTKACGQPSGAHHEWVEAHLSDIDSARNLLSSGCLNTDFKAFLEAAVAANAAGRLDKMVRVDAATGPLAGFSAPNGLRADVLGPVPLSQSSPVHFEWLGDYSHTINGHSVVLKLTYNGKSVLLAGDTNQASQSRLLRHHNADPVLFKNDVFKCAHHGASDYCEQFLRLVSPQVTVISSGDNESFSHPRADVLGAAGKFGGGNWPLVFSTELARSYDTAEHIRFGMIQVRTDGESMVAAQLKESLTYPDPWDAYTIPFASKECPTGCHC